MILIEEKDNQDRQQRERQQQEREQEERRQQECQEKETIINQTDSDVPLMMRSMFEQRLKAMQANASIETQALNDPEYGLDVNKPVFTHDIAGSEQYLQSLMTDHGEKLTWQRLGSTSAKGISGMIDIYQSYLLNGKEYKTIYVCIYGFSRPQKAPQGFTMTKDSPRRVEGDCRSRRRNSRNLSYRVAVGGLLVTLMLILGYVESLLQPLVPVPVPGIKLGLSNGVLLFGLYLMDIPTTVIMMLLKVGLSGLLFGSPMTMLFALCGGVLSLVGMIPLSRVRGVNVITVSMVGAVLHNAGQILAAMMVMTEVSAGILLRYLAVLMAIALVTGAATGVLARIIIDRLGHVIKWK